MKIIGIVAGIVAAVVAAVVLNGYVFSWLWLWFAVPLGLPPIGVALAIGICMLLRNPVSDMKTEDETDWTAALTKTFGEPLFTFGVGWIVHQFV